MTMRSATWILPLALLGAIGLTGCDDTPPQTVPTGCATNADCKDPLNPICEVATKKCLACVADSTCPSGQKCDKTKNKCVECIAATDCGVGKVCVDNACKQGCSTKENCAAGEVCKQGSPTGVCVQCASSADCAANMMSPKCDTTTNKCVACVVDRDCAAGMVCKNNACAMGCTTDQPCPAGKVCLATVCVDCAQDADCKTPAAPRCDAKANICVACLSDKDNCEIGKYCKDNMCVDGCRADTDCTADGKKKCIVATHTCVGCLADTDCKAGTVCDTMTNACVAGCKADSDCAAGNPPPASQGKPRCLVGIKTCVACIEDGDCPLKNMCDKTKNECKIGCNSDARCESGSKCCSEQCVTLVTAANCGACGVACAKDESCCSGSCKKINTDQNCGGCGVTCGAGQTCCGTACATLQGDEKNCGACGKACNGTDVCCGGQCRPSGGGVGACLDCSKPCNLLNVATDKFGVDTTLTKGMEATDKGLHTVDFKPEQFEFVWIATSEYPDYNASIPGKAHKIDAKSGKILGVYTTVGRDSSRGAQAFDGSFWIGNRGFANPNDGNISNVVQIKPDGTLGCVVKTAADGAAIPIVRALAIDADGFVWYGTWNDRRIHKIDPVSCKTVLDIQPPGYAYGLAVDSKGKMWHSYLSGGPPSLIDTKTGKVEWTSTNYPSQTYGIVLDRKDNAYMGQWSPCYDGVFRFDASSKAYSTIQGANGNCTRGVTIDADGNIWAAEWNGSPSCAVKFKGEDGSGAYVGRYCFSGVTYGVGISGDPFGKVWLTGKDSHNYVRFDMKTGAADTGFPMALQGQNPYNYSDWNGYSLRTVTTHGGQQGTWNKVFDSKSGAAAWQSASWTSDVPAGTTLRLKFRAANTPANLATAAWCGPFDKSPADLLSVCKFPANASQMIEVQIMMTTNTAGTHPSVTDLSLYWQ